jgi:hypothetical protein
MNAKIGPLAIGFALLFSPVCAQESVSDLRGAGQFSKFLTPGQLDSWVFDGEKGETIIAHVVSKQFDPILELAKTRAKDEDAVLMEVDDPGNESRFMFRLPEKGQFKIRVHAFKYQGGGNYNLTVQRFQATELTVGKPLLGSFDREGKSYHYFQGVKDRILVPQLKGAASEAWKMLDFKGRPLTDWAGSVLMEEGGECCLIASGPPSFRYDLLVREARRQDLAEGKALRGNLQQGELDVVSFQGKAGDFRVLEVEKKGELAARLKFAPVEIKSDEQRFERPGARPEIEFLPVASRGSRLRFAAVLGRAGRYQLQLLAETPASYTLTARDPSAPIELGKEVDGSLPVGGAAFFSFKAVQGQLVQATVASQKFVPVLRLFDAHGSLVGASGNDGDAEGRLTHTVVHEGIYRLQASSLGDGGGGDFRLGLSETKLKQLTMGGRGQGTVQPGVMDFWAFNGKEGQTVFLNVRSAAFEPSVSLRSPDGVQLGADNKGSAATGSLLALKLPKTGRYMVWISSSRGAGEYVVRLIDGD